MNMHSLNLVQIARALGGEVSGNEVLAPGPNHSRDDRSLSVRLVSQSPDGFIVHSFAADDPLACRDYVRGRLGLAPWEPARSGVTDRVAAEYVYRDADGQPYLRVQRTHEKAFWQSHWTGTEWAKGKPQGPKVPYRLPELLADENRVVMIVEGEKDADALASRGFIATTASEGAGKWSKDLNRWFVGKSVCIVPDNDPPGRAHAQLVASQIAPVAKAVRIVHLPGVPEKGDVSTWFDQGGDNDGLVDICRAAAPFKPGVADSPAGPIRSRPFLWVDPASIPRREWLYGQHYVRRFVSTTVAPGGVGKSSLAIVEALAMASGKPLLGIMPPGRCKVWYFNGEDPYDELERRVMAAVVHYGLTPSDFEGWLRVNSGRDSELVVAEQTKGGVQISVPVVELLKGDIRENGTDVLIIDPFVSSHAVSENDNGAINAVAKVWAGIANETNAAVDLVHHARKVYGAEVTVEDGRGASALLSAARSGRVLNTMSEDEAAKAGVERRRLHFRVDSGKANMAPPPEGSTWFKLASFELANGDDVGVVERWTWPNPLDDVSLANLRAAQKAVAGGKWRDSVQAKEWVGHAIAGVLDLDVSNKADKAKVQRLLKIWTANGMFKVVEGIGKDRHPCSFVEVGEWAND